MGKPTGFMEYERNLPKDRAPEERIKDWDEFHTSYDLAHLQCQGARCMNCGVPFCQNGKPLRGMVSGCPLNNLIPEWNELVYRGKPDEALKRLLMTNNFPEFTSRVCPALCEKACTCGLDGDPVSVRDNENYIIENGYKEGLMQPDIPSFRSGKKVAVIGSGPSGLAAADTLNRRGHSVTVYERSDRIGGLLMYGIPNMKLEKWVVERRKELMEAEGVTFITNADVGRTVSAEEIKSGYDAVILACGASKPRDINAPGRDSDGICFAVDFLKSVTKGLLDSDMKDTGSLTAKDKNVVVIGGGDTGNDCIGTAVRQGCKSVVQLEMMPKLPDERAENNPWPEWPKVCKTDYGQEEAAYLFGHDPRLYETTVKEFIKDESGKLSAIKIVKLKWNDNPETGRKTMEEIKDSEQIIPCELCLIAAGFTGSESYVSEAFGAELNQRTNVKTEPGRFSATSDGVFTAGDMHRGQSLVVWAIYEGRKAAREVDEYLMGYSNLL